MGEAQSVYKDAKILPKSMIVVGLGCFIVVTTPMVYLSMKTAGSGSLVA